MGRLGFMRAAIAAVAMCASASASADNSARFLLFSGIDLWRGGHFGHAGAMWSPGGVDREGFTLKAALSTGVYRYTSGALGNATVIGRELGAQILPGWRFQRERLEIKVFAGLELREHRLTPDDPSAGLRGNYAGLRGEVNVWHEPTNNSMLAFDTAASTIGSTYSARLAYGWRVLDRFYLGPEIGGFTCTDYEQFRLGVHATAFRYENFEWSAALGYARDSDDRSGLYGRLGLLTRY